MSSRPDAAVEECPEPDLLDQYFERTLEEAQRRTVQEHVDRCDDCREFVAALARYELESGASDTHDQPSEGDRVDRYTIGRKLGAGAMGVVYEAYDDSLHRRVALKFLNRALAAGPSARARIFAEARAMARVSHENVAQVYEAAVAQERVFIAMELVSGRPLTQWLRARSEPRAWRAVLDMFILTAKGLAAAHAAGVVHRDFKPDNVLMSARGTPKIVDFGLSGVPELQVAQDSSPAETAKASASAGTPLYMSPEVWSGGSADAKSDQFSFCVALYAALMGQQPFPGTNLLELRASVLAQRLDTSATPSKVRARLHRAVLRGLRADPSERWPSMDALTEELSSCRRAYARRPLWMAAAAIAVVSGGAGALGAADVDAPCPAADEYLAGVWDSSRRAGVTQNLGTASQPHVDALMTGLDTYAERWGEVRTQACQRVVERASEARYSAVDPALECLADARRALDAAAGVLETRPASELADTVGVLHALPDLETCARADGLASNVEPPPPEIADKIRAARQQLAAARALRGAGLLDEAARSVAAANDTLVGIEYGPVRDELRLAQGLTKFESAQYDPALEDLLAVFRSTLRQGRDGLAGEAARALSFVLQNFDVSRLSEARAYALFAHDLASRRGDRSAILKSESRLSQIARAAGEPHRALAHADAAIRLHETRDEPDRLLTATLYSNRAVALGGLGRLEDAEQAYRRTLELDVAVLGEDHVRVAQDRSGLAAALGAQGRFEAALQQLRTGQRLLAATFPPNHRHNVDSHHNIGVTLLGMRRFEGAEAEFRALLDLDPFPGSAATELRVRRSVAAALVGQGRFAEAVVEARAAVEHAIAVLEPDHADAVASLEVLGGALAGAGDSAEAATIYADVVQRLMKQFPADHPSVLRTRIEHEALLWRTHQRPASAALSELESLSAAAAQKLGTSHAVSLRTHTVIAQVLEAQRRIPQAEASLRRALQFAPSGSALEGETAVALARLLHRSGQFDEAAAVLPNERLSTLLGRTRAEGLAIRGYADWARGHDREAATAHVQAAATYYEQHPRSSPDKSRRVRAWLLAHARETSEPPQRSDDDQAPP